MLSPQALVAAVSATALALAEGRSDDELTVMAAVLSQLGDTLATISASRTRWENLNTCASQKSDKPSDIANNTEA